MTERSKTGRLLVVGAVLLFAGLIAVSLMEVAPWKADEVPANHPDAAAGAQSEDTAPVPSSLASLDMSDVVDGAEAIVQTEQLHGKGLGRGLDEAWIAKYGTGEITLWVSRSHKEEEAGELTTRMTESIRRSETPFTGLEELEYPAAVVYGLDGMGQRHFYFKIGRDLFWLAAPPPLAEEALADLFGVVAVDPSSAGRG